MENKKTNGLAIAGMIVGILSILIMCSGFFGTVTGIIGLVLSIVAQNKEKSGMGLAGIITSAIAIVTGIGFGVLYIVAFDSLSQYSQYYM